MAPSNPSESPQGHSQPALRLASRTRTLRLYATYTIVAALLLGSGYLFSDELRALVVKLEQAVTALGPAAPIGMAVVCATWGVLCLPGPLMQGAVGTLFAASPTTALAVVVVGETGSQAVSFTIGRFLGRERVKQSLGDKPWFARLETEADTRGFYGVALFRLMPFFPNALASYAFGLTSLRFWSYLLASIVGSFPKLVLYVYGTTSAVQALRSETFGSLSPQTLAVGVVSVCLLAWALGRALRRSG